MQKQNIFITGATGGLGSIICEHLIEKKYEIIAVANNNRAQAIKLQALAQEKNLEFQFSALDLTDINIQKTLENTISPANVDHLVLTHGVNFNHDILTLDQKTLEESYRINFLSNFLIAQHFIKNWINTQNLESRDKTITYIGSVATETGSAHELAYHAAKRAMSAAMLSFAREFANKKIRANIISPGLMNVGMGKKTVTDRPDVLSRIPLKKTVEPQEIAQLITWIFDSQSVTGQNFHVNSGRYFTI